MNGKLAGTLPLKTLDELIVRTALIEARRLLARDLTPREAVEQACPGAWFAVRDHVLRRLTIAEVAVRLPLPLRDAA